MATTTNSAAATEARCIEAIQTLYDQTILVKPAESEGPDQHWHDSQTLLRETFRRELFLFAQFNGHYLAWIKGDIDHQTGYLDRVLVFLDHLMSLCRLNGRYRYFVPDGCDDRRLRRWLLQQSVADGFHYRRSLRLTVTNVQSEFQFERRLSVYLCVGNGDGDHHPEDGDTIYLGKMDLCSGSSTMTLQLPLWLNYVTNDVYFKVRMEEAEVRMLTVLFAETAISGYNGCQQELICRETVPGGSQRDTVRFTLCLAWTLDHAPVLDPDRFLTNVDNMRFVACSLLYLGNYYWHFVRTYFRTQYTRVLPSVQQKATGALRHLRNILYSLFLAVDEPINLTELFVAAYHDSDDLEPFDLHNLCWAFPHLTSDQQLHYLDEWLPWLTEELGLWRQCHLQILVRLVSLVSHDAGNYPSQSLQSAVVPFCIHMIRRFACTPPSITKQDPDPDPPSGRTVLMLVHAGINLLLQCIDYLKPVNWHMLTIEEPGMAPILAVLDHLIDSLLADDHSLQLLYVIYLRLKRRRMLLDRHLLPFLTEERLQAFHGRCGRHHRSKGVNAGGGGGGGGCLFYSK